jgi:hypothetical protein
MEKVRKEHGESSESAKRRHGRAALDSVQHGLVAVAQQALEPAHVSV